MTYYQAEVYFASEIEDKNKEEFVGVVTPSWLHLQVSIVMPLLIQVLQKVV